MFGNRKNLYLYLIYLAALLPIVVLRDFTPSNELRYLSIADEAIADGSFFAFTNQGEPYADKPPLYLWGMMLCRWIAGGHYMWLLSLLSVVPAIVIARVFSRWSESELRSGFRVVSQLMLLTAGLFLVSSVVLRMDMLMCMFIVLALRTFWKIYTGEGSLRRSQWLFPLWVFLAVFSKGPIGILVPLVSTVCFLLLAGKWRLIFKVWGWRCWSVLLAGCACWFGAVYADGGPEYLDNLLFHQTVDRAVNSFHHAAPFYYYLVSVWYCLVPWSLVMLSLIVRALRGGVPMAKLRASGLQGFFNTVAVSTLVMLSCISSKIQIYMLPAVPFIVYSMAISLSKRDAGTLEKLGFAVIAAVFSLMLPAFAVARYAVDSPYLDCPWFWLSAAALSCCGIYVLAVLYRRNVTDRSRKAVAGLGAAMLSVLFTAGLGMPWLNDYIGYGNLSEKILEKSSQCGALEVRTWGVRRPQSMDVYLHRDVVEIQDDDYYPEHLAADSVDTTYILAASVKRLDRLPGLKADTVGQYCVMVVDKAVAPVN